MTSLPTKHIKSEKENSTLIQQAGFTLIELSIVLVIIGLIVGGVLTGQDLIKAAELRATVSQYEKYNTSMNTFRNKYNGMPGDLLAANAIAFGLGTASTTVGDGNGLIESTSTTNLNIPSKETLVIWQQLSGANLIDGAYGSDLTAAGATAVTTVATYLPAAKSGRGAYWLAGSSGGLNYFAIAGATTFAAAPATTYATTVGGPLTPVEAFNIDTKVDDGMPNSGIVQARGYATMAAATDTIFPALSATSKAAWTVTTPAATDCVTGGAAATDATNTYLRTGTGASGSNCSLRLRMN